MEYFNIKIEESVKDAYKYLSWMHRRALNSTRATPRSLEKTARKIGII